MKKIKFYSIKNLIETLRILMVISLNTNCTSSFEKHHSFHDSKEISTEKISNLESEHQSRIGIYAFDLVNGKSFFYRADERFPFCSSFKFLVSAAILAQATEDSLNEVIHFNKSDLISYSPFSRKNLSTGMTVKELCRAVHFSDNTATNILIKRLGGIEAINNFARSIGDESFHLDRFEPDLNTAFPGDLRDTSTPRAMANSLKKIVFDNVLNDSYKKQFVAWLIENDTGIHRIRAGIPKSWIVGDKTGTCDFGTTNDVGFVLRSDGSAVVMAIFVTGNRAKAPKQEHLISRSAEIAIDSLRS